VRGPRRAGPERPVIKAYIERMGARPSVAKVKALRAAAQRG
jgi:glutathione S-transferase